MLAFPDVAQDHAPTDAREIQLEPDDKSGVRRNPGRACNLRPVS
jgi:hypothetical protein